MIIEGSASDARHPLVVAEASETGRAALLAGVACAQRNGGRLSVIYLLPPPRSSWFGAAGPLCCVSAPPQAVDDFGQGEEVLAAARADVPAEVPVCTQLLTGSYSNHRQVVRAAEALGCDAIFVPRSRRFLSLRRGLGATLARRAQLPVSLIERPSQNFGPTPGMVVAEGPEVVEAVAATLGTVR